MILMPATLPIAEDRIRYVAYALWLEEGCPEGRAESHWLKALEMLAAESSKPGKTPVRKASPRRKTASEAAAPAPAPRKQKTVRE
jgi:hypothetical protein